jgi:hypothetical protein
MTPQEEFRAIAAEAIAISYVMATDPDLRIVGVDHEELKKRALIRLQLEPALKFSLTLAIDRIEEACRTYSDSRINQLLQPGMSTLTLDGRKVDIEMSDSFMDAKLHVTNTLTGAGLDVSDGAFVVFVDSRAATTEALKRWKTLVNDDTKLMMIPLAVPKGQTVEQVVKAKRQDDSDFISGADLTGGAQ